MCQFRHNFALDIRLKNAVDALTATKPGVFVLDIKTIPALFHLTNQPRQKLSAEANLIPQERMEPLDFLRVAGRIVRDTATKVVD